MSPTGERVKALLLADWLTLDEVAEAAGCTRDYAKKLIGAMALEGWRHDALRDQEAANPTRAPKIYRVYAPRGGA